MKKYLVMAILCASAATGFGAALPAEQHEFRADVMVPFSDDGNRAVPFMGGVGYFVMDNTELGLYVSMRKTQWDSAWGPDTAWGLGLFGEYDIDWGSPFVPFLTARIGVLDGDEQNDTALNIFGGGGVRFFVTEKFSLSAQIGIDWASKDVFNFNRTGERPEGSSHDHSNVIGSGDHAEGVASFGARYMF